MDFNKFRNLFLESLKFRRAIEECDKELLPSPFNSFPKGCCYEASVLLAYYLKLKGFGEFNYISGSRMKKIHGWLVQGEFAIDITADQFADNNENVVVSVNSEWHKEFKIEIQQIADINSLDEKSRETLSNAFTEILKIINTNE